MSREGVCLQATEDLCGPFAKLFRVQNERREEDCEIQDNDQSSH